MSSNLPNYKKPPVIEVAFAVRFKTLENLKAPHTGLFWDKLTSEQYPECEEKPPISLQRELFGKTPERTSIQVSDKPPLPRIWYINQNRNHLVQLQSDGFFQNWRKLESETEYPHYETLFPMFSDSWEMFQEFCTENNLGSPNPIQYELTYVNHIPKGDGWNSLDEIGNIFKNLHSCKDQNFLKELDSIAFRKIYRMPDQAGRLYVNLSPGIDRKTGQQILVLDITARGFGTGNLSEWFKLAHEWIVKGFADLTNETVQDHNWGKI